MGNIPSIENNPKNSVNSHQSMTISQNSELEVPINNFSQIDQQINPQVILPSSNTVTLNPQNSDSNNVQLEKNQNLNHSSQHDNSDLIPFAIITNINTPPTESRVVNVQLTKNVQQSKNHIIAIPSTVQIHGVQFEQCLCGQDTGNFQILIDNLRGSDLSLSKGTIIGKAELCNFDETNSDNFIELEYPHNNDNIGQNNDDLNQNSYQNNTVFSDHNRSILFDKEFNKTDYPEYESQLKALLNEFQDVIALTGDELGLTNLIEHKISIPPNTKPIYIPKYRTPHSQQIKMEQEINKLEEQNIIEPSMSPWSFPLISVPKKDGGRRLCVDFRKLNSLTPDDKYPMPHLADLINSVGKSKFFSNMDLMMGFHQIPLSEKSKQYTAFSTNDGLYHYTKILMGLKSAPQTFVRLMNQVFKGLLGKIIHVYMDDFVVTGNTFQEHLSNIRLVLERLRDANLKLKLSKCFFLKKQCNFLGHTLSADGVKVNEDKIKSINNFQHPTNVKSVRSFLGLAGFYRKFIKNFATIASPITDLLKEKTEFIWGPEQENAFQILKTRLTQAPILTFPNFNLPFYLYTDASGVGIGSALMQKIDNKLKVIGYHSRKLSGAEKNYGITELECLAVIDSLRHFRYIIFGYHVTVVTDHIALRNYFKEPNQSHRRARWFLKLRDYDVNFQYIPGKQNLVADCLTSDICL